MLQSIVNLMGFGGIGLSIFIWSPAALAAWTPPIGIPAPDFGIEETYRLYDNSANRNPALPYNQNSEGGFYTHYVNYETGTDTNNPYGTAASPRRTIPNPLPEGSVVELHGLYSANNGGYFPVASQGIRERPVFVRGLNQTERPATVYKMVPTGTYLIVENILFRAAIDFDLAPDYIAVRHCEFMEIMRNAVGMGGTSTDFASYIVVYKNEIHNRDNGWDQGTGDTDNGGVHISRFSHHIWVLENHLYHNAGGGVNIGSLGYPIDDIHHIYVGRNEGHHNRQVSFGCKVARDVIYSENRSHHNGLSNQAGELGGGFITQYGPENVWLINNVIHDSEAGIRIASYGTPDVQEHFYAIGNLIYDIDAPLDSFASGVGIANRGANLMYCVNNTLFNVKAGIKEGGIMVNNTIANVHSGDFVITEANTTPFLMAHNVMYNSGGTIFIDYGNISGDVDRMQTALPGQAYGNIVGDPLFVDGANGDFALQSNSPGRDAGVESAVYDTFLSLYGLDIRVDPRGIPRPAGAGWDIGAYEYVSELYLTSPHGGETWTRGFSHDITWGSSGVTEPVKIELYKGSTLDHVIAENVAVTAGSYAWPVSAGQSSGNDYHLKLTAGTYADTSGVFTIAVPAAPMATTHAATAVTQNAAVLHGMIHPLGRQTTYYFEYGPTTAYGTTTPDATLNAGADETAVQAVLSGLSADTTYHFRLVASNTEGTTAGADRTFATTTSGGGGGGSTDAGGGGGGGGGGCFVTAAQAGGVTGRRLECLDLWWLLTVLLSAIFLGGVWSGKRKKIIMRIGVMVVTLLNVGGAVQATTIRLEDCSAEAVNSALAAANPGDTVELACTGIVTWALEVNLSGGKTLKGPGTKGITGSAGFWPLTINIASGAGAGMRVVCENNQAVNRVTGLKFQGGTPTYGISITGRGTGLDGKGAFRIDNNYFGDIEVTSRLMATDGSTGKLTGLADHNVFYRLYPEYHNIMYQNTYRGVSPTCFGYDSLHRPAGHGSDDFVFYEDNYFFNSLLETSDGGGRVVVRYNEFASTSTHNDFAALDGHGADTGQHHCCGIVANEFYKNRVTGANAYSQVLDMRGGKWMVHNNSVQSGHFQFQEYRAGGPFQCLLLDWNSCSGSACCQAACKQCPTDSAEDLAVCYPLPNQAHDTYLWNNIKNGTDMAPLFTGQYTPAYIVLGRDYWMPEYGLEAALPVDCTVGSYYGSTDSGKLWKCESTNVWNLEYVPFPYPHPLRTSDNSFVLIAPVGDETWVRGFHRNITWSSSGVTAPVRIELYKDGALNRVIAENQAVADGSYSWLIPSVQAAGNDYTVKLTAGIYESVSGNFSIAAPGPPVVTTDPAASVTQTEAVLRGRARPLGYQTTYHFEYGLTTAYGATTPDASLNADADETGVQAALTGLIPNTTYHFRLYATNSAGTTEGADRIFATTTSGGSGGGSTDAGGGGGCFIKAAQSRGETIGWLESWGIWLFCMALWLGICLRRQAALARVFRGKSIERNGYRKNKHLFFLLWVSYLLFSIPVYAAPMNAENRTRQEVQAAIDKAPDGDMVRVPAGSATRDRPLKIKKGLILERGRDGEERHFGFEKGVE